MGAAPHRPGTVKTPQGDPSVVRSRWVIPVVGNPGAPFLPASSSTGVTPLRYGLVRTSRRLWPTACLTDRLIPLSDDKSSLIQASKKQAAVGLTTPSVELRLFLALPPSDSTGLPGQRNPNALAKGAGVLCVVLALAHEHFWRHCITVTKGATKRRSADFTLTGFLMHLA